MSLCRIRRTFDFIVYLLQIIEFENDNVNLFEYFKDELSVSEQKVRQIRVCFGFYKYDDCKRFKTLSGGEKIKV